MVLPPPDCADEPLVVAIDLLPAEKDRGVRQSSLDVGTGDRRLRRVGHHRPIGDAVVLVARSRVVVELVIAEHTDVLGFQEKVETLEREGVASIYSSASPWVGSQPCGAKYPGFCADSKGV